MLYLGIDPGLDGFVAVIDRAAISTVRTPTVTVTTSKKRKRRVYERPKMARILRRFRDRCGGDMLAAIEAQHPRPAMGDACPRCGRRGGEGVVSSHRSGVGYGLWLGMLEALGIPHRIVHPQTWKRHMLANTGGGETKARSVMAALTRFPGVDLRKSKRAHKPDHNKAEALLLAAYACDVLARYGPAPELEPEPAPEPSLYRQFTDLFCERWAAVHHTKYPFAGAKDGRAAARVFATCHKSMDEAERVVVAYLAETDPFYEGHSLAKLAMDLPKFMARAVTPKKSTRQELGNRIADLVRQRRGNKAS